MQNQELGEGTVRAENEKDKKSKKKEGGGDRDPLMRAHNSLVIGCRRGGAIGEVSGDDTIFFTVIRPFEDGARWHLGYEPPIEVDPDTLLVLPALVRVWVVVEVWRVVLAWGSRLVRAVIAPQLISTTFPCQQCQGRLVGVHVGREKRTHPRLLNHPFLLWLGKMGLGHTSSSHHRIPWLGRTGRSSSGGRPTPRNAARLISWP